jgi:hypothetical protein
MVGASIMKVITIECWKNVDMTGCRHSKQMIDISQREEHINERPPNNAERWKVSRGLEDHK